MSERELSPGDLEEHVEDLRRYLADDIPPLLAAGAVEALLRGAPETVVGQIQGWLSFQHQARHGAASAADLAFHALRKLHVLGDLGLVPPAELAGSLDALAEALALLCPPEDRELVRTTPERLRQARHQPGDSSFLVGGRLPDRADEGGGAAAPISPQAAAELRRFSVLLARLKRQAGPGAASTAAPAPAPELVASLFAAAASSAGNAAELGKYLEHLREHGVEATDPAAVVRTLSRALPAWAPPAPPKPESLAGTARALHRFVDLAETSQQRLERFRELVAAVVEAFNAGSLPRAVALVQVAAGLLGEDGPPMPGADLVLDRAHEALDGERLRLLAVDPLQQPLLRQLMELFPGLRPEGLLDDLDGEPDRARRRVLLTLIEVHGPAARPALLERVEASLDDRRDNAWFLQRNLVYLLHRLPCPSETLDERELDLVVQFSELRHHPRVVGEAVIRLAQIADPRAELALQARLEEVERAKAAPGAAPAQREDLERLRALIAAHLLRSGSPAARRSVVEAAVRRLREAGDAAEVAALHGVDLAGQPDLVDELVRALLDRLPRKLLGVTLHRNTETLLALVEGLAATRTPAVRRALAELVERFPREPFGVAAARALEASRAQEGARAGDAARAREGVHAGAGIHAGAGARAGEGAPAGETPAGDEPAAAKAPPAAEDEPAPAAAPTPAGGQRMEGDLQLFGLPNLLQSLAQSQLSGTLTLRDERGAPVAVLELRRGDLAGCSAGRLAGDTAFYQLLERPTASSFAFLGREAADGAGADGSPPRAILGLLMEGMRRYDEYQRARAVVPDATVLVATGARPTSLPGETDGSFVRDLWSQVKARATAAQCEDALAADAYRVRALLAHWLAEGALAVDAGA